MNESFSETDCPYSAFELTRFGDAIPLRTPSELTADSYLSMLEMAYAEDEILYLDEGEEDCYLSSILDAKYEAMDIEQVMENQSHLTKEQQIDLQRLLLKYPQLFDGKLGRYPKLDEDTLRGIEEIEIYIDDVGCFSESWENHLETLDQVLARLAEAGFSINPLKCGWAVKETD